ncbi:MAG: methyltransferase domain-containing protein [Candidatus Altiarchaeota archaeon]
MGIQKDIYERYWTDGGPVIGSYMHWRLELLKNYIKNNKRILDVGCGDGNASGNFTRDNDLFGIDISQVALKKALERRLRVCACNIDDGEFPFKDGSFDLVLILDVLEHIINPATVLKEARRVSSETGLMIVTVPNGLNLMNRLYFLSGKFVDVFDQNHRYKDRLFTEHIRLFSKEVLEKMVVDEGLEIVDRHYYFPSRFEETNWKKFQTIGDIIYKTDLYRRMPTLFSLGLFYVLTKST